MYVYYIPGERVYCATEYGSEVGCNFQMPEGEDARTSPTNETGGRVHE